MESQKPDQPSDKPPTEEAPKPQLNSPARSRSPDVDLLHRQGRPPLKKLSTSTTHERSKIPPALAPQNLSPSLLIAPDRGPVEDAAESVWSEDCATPKSKEHLLPVEAKVCPPAPKKRVSKRKRKSPPPERFFVPSDVHGFPDCFKAVFD